MMTRKTAVQALMAVALVAGGTAYTQEQPATPAEAAPPAPVAAGPVASTDGEQPGIRIDVTELKRSSGDTVTLRLSLVNGSSEGFSLADSLRLRGSGYNISGIYLLDPANKKKYQVIMGADDQCVCSSGVPYTLEAGKTINLWAKFPAPPADVAEIGVVVPHFIPMDGVPIAP